MRGITTLMILVCLVAGSRLTARSVPPASFTWPGIEDSIQQRKWLQSCDQQLAAYQTLCIQAASWPEAARCMYNRMRIADARSGDSLFWKNAGFMDSILRKPSAPEPLRLMMYLLKAQRVVRYRAQFLSATNRKAVRDYDGGQVYAGLSGEQLYALCMQYLDSALALTANTGSLKGDALLWLSSDPLMTMFTPSVADLLYVEKVVAAKDAVDHVSVDTSLENRMQLSQDAFLALPDTTFGRSAEWRQLYHIYYNWMRLHKGNPEKIYYIETLWRRNVYRKVTWNEVHDTVLQNRYAHYLRGLTISPWTTVKVAGILNLAIYLNQDAGKYRQVNEDYGEVPGWGYNPFFDTTKRWGYAQIEQLLQVHVALLDSFPIVRNTMVEMLRAARRPGLLVRTPDSQLPGKPVPVRVTWRNISGIYLKLVRTPMDNPKVSYGKRELPMVSAVYEKHVPLLATNDYQWHVSVLKLDTLPAGYYTLFFSERPFTDTTEPAGSVRVKVSAIGVLAAEGRVYVVHSHNGFPLAEAQVEYKNKKKQVNREGFVVISGEEGDTLLITSRADSVRYRLNTRESEIPEKAYDSDYYDNLMEYYEDNTVIHFYRDRAIYRPGQLVQFKGILVTHNTRTGEEEVLNWRNLAYPFYQKLWYKLMVALRKKHIRVYLKDAFNKPVDSLDLRPNSFGSLAGTFRLPKEAVTGDWRMTTGLAIDERNESFTVEAYRKPTFQVNIKRPGMPGSLLALKDSFHVPILVQSFAGAGINGAAVKCIVERSVSLPNGQYESGTLFACDTVTGADGRYTLVITDKEIAQMHFPDSVMYTANYYVSVTVTDATGESHDEHLHFPLSNRPVQLTVKGLKSQMNKSAVNSVYVMAESKYGGAVAQKVTARIYRESGGEYRNRGAWEDLFQNADIALYPAEQWRQWFPEAVPESSPVVEEGRDRIWDTTLYVPNGQRLWLPRHLLGTGNYVLELISKQQDTTTGTLHVSFAVYDPEQQSFTRGDRVFNDLVMEEAGTNAGKATWITGHRDTSIYSIYQISWLQKGKKKNTIEKLYLQRRETSGLHTLSFQIPEQADGQVQFTHVFICGGRSYEEEKSIYVRAKNTAANLSADVYRTQLTPGGKEKMVVSVKNLPAHTRAELMTVMYDGALEKLEKHRWEPPFREAKPSRRSNWDVPRLNYFSGRLLRMPASGKTVLQKAFWWMRQDSVYQLTTEPEELVRMLQGRTAGVSVQSDLNDVVVIGYGTRQSVTGSVTRVVTFASKEVYADKLIVLDGVIIEKGLAAVNQAFLTDAVLVTGMEATALYGSKAVNGVLLLSTKGRIQLPASDLPPPPLVIRKNFNETAFFLPQLRADKKGKYQIQFMLPESVTEWRWKMLAHTRKGISAYAEKTLVSTLPLMVQPHLPRFVYQGDELVVKSRITNTDAEPVTGNIRCFVTDAVTEEDITGKLLTESGTRPFQVNGSATTTGSFRLRIPENMLHPLTIRIQVSSPVFSDGEEHVIPVLSRRVLITEQLPFTLAGKDTVLHTPALPADAVAYGAGLYLTPPPQAALLHALPWLATYPYDCTEQTFNKALAYAAAIQVARTKTGRTLPEQKEEDDAAAQERMDDPVLPAEKLMPWRSLDKAGEIHRKQLLALLDSVNAKKHIALYMEEVFSRQHKDGGLSWYRSEHSDWRISCYVLAGLGKMQTGALWLPEGDAFRKKLTLFTDSLIRYCDEQITGSCSSRQQLLYLYARSYWLQRYPLPAAMQLRSDTCLQQLAALPQPGPGGEALLAGVLWRYGSIQSRYRAQAAQLLESLRQRAVMDTTRGIRWKALEDGDDLDAQTEEWLVLLAEAFENTGSDEGMVKGIIQWLLGTKYDHNWSTTKATAEVVTLLARQQQAVLPPVVLNATMGGIKMRVHDNPEDAWLYDFRSLWSGLPATATVTKTGERPVKGTFQYYYFTQQPAAPAANGVTLQRTLEWYDSALDLWKPVDSVQVLPAAAKVRVTLHVFTPRFLRYVLLEDARPAALEPESSASGYEYQNHLGYYKAVTDAGTRFFADRIPAGDSYIRYETVVNNEGKFSAAPASLQCMYAPDVKAWSAPAYLKTGK